MSITAYLAGPDVFLPEAAAHAARKVAICARFGLTGRPPLGEDAGTPPGLPEDRLWRAIYDNCVAMMEACDIVIANLTPFRGPSADAGTLVELGWFLGRGKPVFAYSNTATPFAERSRRHQAAVPDPVPGLMVEGFGLADNLMIPGAVLQGGGHPVVLPADGVDRPFDSLEVFTECARLAAGALRR